MNSKDDDPHPLLAILFLAFCIAFFGGGLLLFINVFVPFLPETAMSIISLGVGAVLVVGVIAGKCYQVILTLRGVTKADPPVDLNSTADPDDLPKGT